MAKRGRRLSLALISLVLTLAILACGTGYQTSSKVFGDSGEVRVRMKEADGTDSTSVELNEDWFSEGVSITATLSVESGSCQATLKGGDGGSLVLSASGGSPGQVTGALVTDGFGEIDLETVCQSGVNLDLLINFTR